MNKLIMILIILVLINGCNSDYDKDLGNNYHLIKTNACCIYIIIKNDDLQLTTGIPKGREVKPMIKKIWYNNLIILGYKEKNDCCFLADYEIENPNGYFIIDKKTKKIIYGLDRKSLLSSLKKYHVDMNNITFEKLK